MLNEPAELVIRVILGVIGAACIAFVVTILICLIVASRDKRR